ncbi:hypothetical protein QTN25_010191 [Entamoeba marina]
MLTNDYIPYKRNSKTERNKIFPFEFFINRDSLGDYINETEYYKYDIDSYQDIEQFNTIFNSTLPYEVAIDIGKKKGIKSVMPKQISFLNLNRINFLNKLALVGNTGGKSTISISLPSTVQQLAICGNSYMISIPNYVKELMCFDTNVIQTTLTEITKLSIHNKQIRNEFDLSFLNKLKECYVVTTSNKLIFPNTKLDLVEIQSVEIEELINLSTNKLIVRIGKNFKSFDDIQLTSLTLNCVNDNKSYDLSNKTTLTSFECQKWYEAKPIDSYLIALPTSLKELKLGESLLDTESNHFFKLISNITSIESLSIPNSFMFSITHLSNLTSLSTTTPYLDKTSKEKLDSMVKQVDLSGLTKLVYLDFQLMDSLPKFPISLTKIRFNPSNFKVTTEITDRLTYLTNLRCIETPNNRNIIQIIQPSIKYW